MEIAHLLEQAQSLVDHGDYQGALRVADTIMETGEATGAAWGIRAICQYRQGALGQAEHAIDRAIHEGGEDADGLVLKAAIIESQDLGRRPEANGLIVRAAQIEPENEAAREAMAAVGREWAESTANKRAPMSIRERVHDVLWHLHEERPSLAAALTVGLGSVVLVIGLLGTIASAASGGSPGGAILLLVIGGGFVAPAAYAAYQTRWFHDWRYVPTQRGYLATDHLAARRVGPISLLLAFYAALAWIWALMWTCKIIVAVASRR
jgi:tetratricopeptide (TPR) repeat protein